MTALDNDPTSHEERRQHLRIVLKAFAGDCACGYHLSGTRREARLVDISPGGARLHAQGDIPAERDQVSLDCAFLRTAGLAEPVAGVVRWVTGRDFGISFSQELPMGVGELQRMIDS